MSFLHKAERFLSCCCFDDLWDLADITGRKIKTDICNAMLEAVKLPKRPVACRSEVSKTKSTTELSNRVFLNSQSKCLSGAMRNSVV